MPARLSLALLAATIATAFADPAGAATATQQTTTTATTATSSPASASSTTTTNKYVDAFAPWAGSTANAQSLMDGLHAGTAITLTGATTSTSGGSTGTTVVADQLTFAPASGPMSVRQASIALAMAQQSLAAQGIAEPTPSQIAAALNGGSITVGTTGTQAGTGTAATANTVALPGVLSLRASHMGWGKIANTLGFKLGPVISGLNHTIRADRIAADTVSGSATASGDAGSVRTRPAAHSYGQGIVSATGAPLSAGYSDASSRHGGGKSVADTSGSTNGSAGASGISTAMAPSLGSGNGGGHGMAHGKP